MHMRQGRNAREISLLRAGWFAGGERNQGCYSIYSRRLPLQCDGPNQILTGLVGLINLQRREDGDHLKPPWSELVFSLLLYVLTTSYFIYTLVSHPVITLDPCVLVPHLGAAYGDSHSLNRKACHYIPRRASLYRCSANGRQT